MADTSALKNRIRAAIKANNNQEITGPVLQQALLDIVDELNGATEIEASQRQSGDSTLQQGINTERQQRQNADNTLQQGINTERQQRQEADTALDQRITEEIQQEAERAEEAFDDLDMIDAAGSQVAPNAISLTLRKNDGSDQDPEWRTLCQLLLQSASNQRAGLMSSAMFNLLYNLRNAGYAFRGIAVTGTNPGIPAANCFYIVRGAGTYTYFKNADDESIVLENDGVYVLIYDSVENHYWEYGLIITIDDEPTAGSNNLVKSGRVQNELALGAVYDVSAKNPTAGPNNDGKWESFSALLSDANLNTLIPTVYRKGGMSIKFVQSSDNKYVQYRLMADGFSTDVANWQGVNNELVDGSRDLIDSIGISNLHYNKIQLAKSTNTDWSKVIVNAYVKDWVGGSKRLFFGQCYKNNPTYGSGIQIFACDADFSNPTQGTVLNWTGAILGNIGQEVKGLQILPELPFKIDGVYCGRLSVEVNWDAIPDGWNAPISPKYYLNIESKPWEKYADDKVLAEAQTRSEAETKINKSLLNQVPYIANCLPMVDKTSNLLWFKDCSPAILSNFLVDFKIVGTPQEGYDYCFRGFNYKSGTQGENLYYCYFGIFKRNTSTDEYTQIATFKTSSLITGYKVYTKDDYTQYEPGSTISDIKVALNWDALTQLQEETYTWLPDKGYKFDQNYLFDLTTGPLAKDDVIKGLVSAVVPMEQQVENLEDAVFEDIVENLTNYESVISGAFIKAANHTIEVNQYTSDYKIYLFRLPAGDYIFETTGTTPASVDVIGIIDSVEDFQVGGVLSESILVGSPSTSVSRTLNSETLVVLLTRNGSQGINFSGYIKKSYKRTKITDIEEQIESIEEQILPSLKIIIPNTVYAVVGTELNLWNDAVSLSVDKGLYSPLNYQIRWNCTKGLITDRCFRFTPSDEDAGHNYTCTCYLYDMRNNLIDSKQFTIKVLAKNALQVAKNIAYFGDSLGQAAAGQLYTDFHNSDKFTGVIPSMVGTRGTTYKYDAVGGNKWLDYATVGRTGYRASVSGVTSISLGAVYTDGVANFEVIEVNIVEGAGNILLQSHYTHHGTLIMPSGTLTKVSGGGDSTVPYTGAFEESANPLWNDTTQQLDAEQYKQLVGLQPTDKIDAVSFQFGVNEAASYNIDNILTYIDSLYHCFVDDNPNCKFIIGLNTSAGNDVNGSGSNYGASFNWISYLEYSYKIRQLYMTLQNNQNYPNIRIAPINLQVDRYYGYALGTRHISQRYAENEQYHNNYVHPGTSGYGQMGDAYFATYVGVLTE